MHTWELILIILISVVFLGMVGWTLRRRYYNKKSDVTSGAPEVLFYVNTVSGPTIPVELPIDSKVSDLDTQLERQLGRKINPLLFQGTPLNLDETLSDAGIGPEATITESLEGYPTTIRFDTDNYTVEAREAGPATDRFISLTIRKGKESAHKYIVTIPITCLRSVESTFQDPRKIVLKEDCDISKIQLIAPIEDSYDPPSISNIDFQFSRHAGGNKGLYQAVHIRP